LAPDVVGRNTTLIVQLAPNARVAPQVPPGAPFGRENWLALEPPIVKVPPVNPMLPVLVTVNVRAALVVPIAWFPNANEVGVTVAVRTAAMPVPLSETGEPNTATTVTPLLPVMASVPLAEPVAVGVKITPTVQGLPAFAPDGILPPQVPPAAPVARENGPVNV
jgi:hypothetical protein